MCNSTLGLPFPPPTHRVVLEGRRELQVRRVLALLRATNDLLDVRAAKERVLRGVLACDA